MALISLTEYANIHGKDESTLRAAARRGKFKTAVKIGNTWAIDSDEELIDLRTREYRHLRVTRKKEEE